MSSEIIKHNYSSEQISIIKNTIAKGVDLNDQELSMFQSICKSRDLNPFANQIYIMRLQGKLCTYVSIDGARLIAGRSGQLNGYSDFLYLNEKEEWQDYWVSSKAPLAVKVTVYRKDMEQCY